MNTPFTLTSDGRIATSDRLISTAMAASQFGASDDTFLRRVKDGTLVLIPIRLGRLVRWSASEVAVAIEAAKANRERNFP